MQSNSISIQKMRRLLWLMGRFKIPMIAYVKPKLISLNEEEINLKIKLRRRSKNHLKSMYFGVMAVGADIAAGLHAFYFAEQSGKKISFVFKSVKAEFLKRATEDVIFSSKEGQKVLAAFGEAQKTGERVNQWITVECLSQNKELVAVFKMEISVKIKD